MSAALVFMGWLNYALAFVNLTAIFWGSHPVVNAAAALACLASGTFALVVARGMQP